MACDICGQEDCPRFLYRDDASPTAWEGHNLACARSLASRADAAEAKLAKVRDWATSNRKSKPFSAEDILAILDAEATDGL